MNSPSSGQSQLLEVGTTLFGRDDDIRRVTRLLHEDGHRMVVLTGPGGIGKTRLGLSIVSLMRHHFREGARIISFESVAADTDLDEALAAGLGLADTNGVWGTRKRIHRHLASRHQLLLIDNVEHVPRIGMLLQSLLAACPDVVLVVTSRSELDVYGEVIHRLDSLLPPASGAHWSVDVVDRVAVSPAASLLLDRVRAVNAEFIMTSDNREAIVGICNHLGGIPLALELIAPHVAARPPAHVLFGLQQPNLHPDQPDARHANPTAVMRDIIRFSYDLLDDRQQRVFRMLSAMRGR